jgi:UPF0755 protein
MAFSFKPSWIFVLLLFPLLAAVKLGQTGYMMFTEPGGHRANTLVWIPKGRGLFHVAYEFERAGIVDQPRDFYWVAQFFDGGKGIRAGEYEIPVGLSPKDALTHIKTTKPYLRRITIAEGTTSAQVADMINTKEFLSGNAVDGLVEGSLLPETYFFERGDERNTVLSRMEKGLDDLINPLWDARGVDFPLITLADVITLASIIEKETAKASERAHIAAVFLNRLRKKMRLQSDPTVIYGITQGLPLGRRLLTRDLNTLTPYNTYKIRGLPPGPIANPGADAIRAVFAPLSSKDLYFVADGTGGHVFARTLSAHNKNVRIWRKIRAQQEAEN